jgi:prenylcysteine oxidase/farnesylcysteine lyase
MKWWLWIPGSICNQQSPLQTPKSTVAIIGSGVGGSSTAYFLKKLKDVNITVFERNDRIGGRIRSLDLGIPGLENVELGGTLISESNRYLTEAVREFGLEKDQDEAKQTSSFGVWNGLDWSYYHDSRYGDWVASLKMLYKYGFWNGPLQVRTLAQQAGDLFMKIYEHLDRRETWSKLDAELERLGMLDYSTESCPSFMDKHHINPEYVYDIVEAISRNIYLSNVEDLHAVGCLLSIYATSFDTYRIKGGNRLLYEAMLRSSSVRLNTSVTRIEKLSNGFLVESWNGMKPTVEHFDQVVMAAPLADSQIQLIGFEYERFPRIEYRRLYVTIVHGQINASYFGVDREMDIPTATLTTNSTNDFHSLGIVKTLNDTHTISKIFSREPMKMDLLRQLYKHLVQVWEFSWDRPGAYPILRPKDNWHLPTRIQGLWYINSMEFWLSTQETESIQARNVAIQIANE